MCGCSVIIDSRRIVCGRCVLSRCDMRFLKKDGEFRQKWLCVLAVPCLPPNFRRKPGHRMVCCTSSPMVSAHQGLTHLAGDELPLERPGVRGWEELKSLPEPFMISMISSPSQLKDHWMPQCKSPSNPIKSPLKSQYIYRGLTLFLDLGFKITRVNVASRCFIL